MKTIGLLRTQKLKREREKEKKNKEEKDKKKYQQHVIEWIIL